MEQSRTQVALLLAKTMMTKLRDGSLVISSISGWNSGTVEIGCVPAAAAGGASF